MNKDLYIVDLREIGLRLRALRKSRDLTQDALAHQIHISTPYLTLIEQGKRSVSIEILAELSHVFGVSTDYLIFGDDSSSTEPLYREWKQITQSRSPSDISAAHALMRSYFQIEDSKR